ncbi:MAG: FAD binding domain-containing protein, partial [Candidatus Heimdallarchaeota archaeon]|nr:FAD binding domain-containing protein [Candidatus Heimdallarchaeota archaeon]MCK4954067.1 FAD binding domain-containing protein [Candidatus Heimdallarchaeota archaeon]
MKFILNRTIVETSESPGTHTLDFIRKLGVKGVKEGCHEGDCGACMVLIGELKRDRVKYRAINSCLLPLGRIEGKHVVTVEGINLEELNPVQQAIADEGGSQCGYCTPGFVIALMAYFINEDFKNADIITAIEGNICRCTGYNSILRSAEIASKKISALEDSKGRIQALIEAHYLPSYFLEIPEKLKKIQVKSELKKGTYVAGGTDLFVNRQTVDNPVFLSELGLDRIWSDNEFVYVGGAAEIESIRISKELNALFDTAKHLARVSTLPIRQLASIGGNVVNASPIGDLTIYFLALDADISLQFNGTSRIIKLKDFFKGYKILDLKEGEILEWFRIRKEKKMLSFEKVAKRMYMDIASVNSALSLKLEDNKIKEPHLSGGGVGPIPMYLEKACNFLENKEISAEVIKEAARIADTEISPIDDIRGSAKYKRLLL